MKAPKISLTNLLQHFAEGWPEGLVLLPSLLTLLAIQMPSHSLVVAGMNAPRRKRIQREQEPWAVKNDGDHGLLSCLEEITCTFLGHRESAPCWRMEIRDVQECYLANRGVPWLPAGLAFEPKLKKAKMEIVHETLLAH